MAIPTIRTVTSGTITPVILSAMLMSGAPAAAAQDTAAEGSGDYLDGLRTCQALADDAARLACFDQAVGRIIVAEQSGDVQVVDREDVRQTKRSLFGFRLPSLGIFDGDGKDESDELFTTTVQSVRYASSKRARITTAEGAVWEMNDIPRNRRQFRAGDTVVFKEASLGYYFLRIGGQTGVKGRRIE